MNQRYLCTEKHANLFRRITCGVSSAPHKFAKVQAYRKKTFDTLKNSIDRVNTVINIKNIYIYIIKILHAEQLTNFYNF